jgi:hypothetical protein
MKRVVFLVLILCSLVLSLGAQTRGDAYESNNSASAAYPLKPGRYNLTFTSGDVDWFSFQVSPAAVIRVYTEGGLDTYLSLYGPDASDLEIDSDDDGGDSYNARLSASLEAGTYYIEAVPYGEDAGSYTLVLETVEFSADGMEPNNNRAQAKTLNISRPPSALNLFPANDYDWFKLNLGAFQYRNGEALVISTTGDIDTYMTLYQGDTIAAENDDEPGGNGNARIAFIPERGSDYYIMVRGYDDGVVGEYGIAVETTTLEFDQYEPNNTRAQATAISPGQTLSGNALADYDMADWFSFTITQPGTYAIGTTGGLDSVISLYDRGDNLLESDDDSGSNNNALIEIRLEPGTYYVEVSQYGGSQYEEYSFYVRPR